MENPKKQRRISAAVAMTIAISAAPQAQALAETRPFTALTERFDREIAPLPSRSAGLKQAFRAYLAGIESDAARDGFRLQARCFPAWEPAAGSGVPKGTVIFHGGFTACGSQQYAALQKRLVSSGYDVIQLILPGHGREPKAVGSLSGASEGAATFTDDRRGLPTPQNHRELFRTFAEATNRIAEAAASSGPVMLVGLSVGSASALYSYLKAPQNYSRVLLFSPYLQTSGEPIRQFVAAHASEPAFAPVTQLLSLIRPEKVPLLLELIKSESDVDRLAGLIRTVAAPGFDANSGWGKGCEAQRDPFYKRFQGEVRAGICQFSVLNVAAVQAFGKYLLGQTSSSPGSRAQAVIQVVFPEHDGAADTDSTVKLFGNGQEGGGRWFPPSRFRICATVPEVPHSSLSPFDQDPKTTHFARETMWWLPRLEQSAIDFLTSSSPLEAFPVVAGERVGSAGGVARCDLGRPTRSN